MDANSNSLKRKREEGEEILCHRWPKKVIEQLKVTLNDDVLAEFRQSCFGIFLKLPNLIFQSNLVYYLLQQLDLTSQSNKIMKFKINGVDVYFGPDQYVTITGLSFSVEPDDIRKSSRLHSSVFKSKAHITLKDVEEAFHAACCVQNDKDQKALKLGLVYFMYATFMGWGLLIKSWT